MFALKFWNAQECHNEYFGVVQPWRRGCPPFRSLLGTCWSRCGKACISPCIAARQHCNPSPVLVVALAAEQPSPQSLRRLEHEYSLAAELDPAWAAKPLALTRHEGRMILTLERWEAEGITLQNCARYVRELITRQPRGSSLAGLGCMSVDSAGTKGVDNDGTDRRRRRCRGGVRTAAVNSSKPHEEAWR